MEKSKKKKKNMKLLLALKKLKSFEKREQILEEKLKQKEEELEIANIKVRIRD